MTIYYMRADGTAANKGAATDPTSASTAMSVATYNSESFSGNDIIYVSSYGGIYTTKFIPPTVGTLGNPITLAGVDGDSPVIISTENAGIHLIRAYNRISNIEITGVDYCMRVGGTTPGVVLSNLIADGKNSAGFSILVESSSGDITLDSCEGTGSTGAGLYVDRPDITVIGGKYHLNGDSGIFIKNTGTPIINVTGAELSGNANDGFNSSIGTVTLTSLDVHDNLSDGIVANGTSVVNVYSTKTYGNGGVAADSGDGFTAHDTSVLNVYNSLAWGNSKSGIAVVQGSEGKIINSAFYDNYNEDSTLSWVTAYGCGIAINSTGDWEIKNNICSHNGLEIGISSSATGIIDSDNNCFNNSRGGDSFHYDGTSYETFSAYQVASSLDADSINDDPEFISAPAFDFHIQPTSPCIGTGTAISGLTTDFEGNQLYSNVNVGPYGAESGTLPVAPSVYVGRAKYNLTVVSGTGVSDWTVSMPAAPELIEALGLSSSYFNATGVPIVVNYTDLLALTGAQLFGSEERAEFAVYSEDQTGAVLDKCNAYFNTGA